MKNDNLDKLLKFDALSEAEKITGKSYKEDKLTEALGFGAFIQNNKAKEKALSELGDTTFHETEESYFNKVTSFGFKEVLLVPFTNEDGIEERLHIMWHYEYSILLVWDTHTWGDDGSWTKAGEEVPPPSRNGGNFYYNWSPNLNNTDRNLLSSGGYISNRDNSSTFGFLFNSDFTPHILPKELRNKEPKIDFDNYEESKKINENWCEDVDRYIELNKLIKIWSGHHDCREALMYNINNLNKNGTFLKEWEKAPFLWLLHYMNTKNKNYDYEKINQERLLMLPTEVQKCIGVTKL